MLRTALLINIYQKRVQALTSRLPLAQLLARAASNPALLNRLGLFQSAAAVRRAAPNRDCAGRGPRWNAATRPAAPIPRGCAPASPTMRGANTP